MTQSHDSAHQPHSLTAEFPMPTSTSLASAYQNLYLAATGADDVRVQLGNPANLPRPWIPASCTERRLRAELWSWLDDVATWLNEQYTWDPAAGMIPPCWPHHPHLVNELAVLADQRRRAALDLTSSSLEEWHRYCLPNFYSRLQARMRTGCDEKHTPWPAQPRHDRHRRQTGQRLDAFNNDLTALDTTGDSDRAGEPGPTLRLATDNGETVDPH